MSDREALRDFLRDENGLPPTEATTDVIIAVIEQTIRTDENHDGRVDNVPTVSTYAKDTERALRVLRKYQR